MRTTKYILFNLSLLITINIYSQSFPEYNEAFDAWRNSNEIKNNTEIPWNLKIDTIKYNPWVELYKKNN